MGMLVFMAVVMSATLFGMPLWSALVMASKADDEMERWAKESEKNEATGLSALDGEHMDGVPEESMHVRADKLTGNFMQCNDVDDLKK